MLMMGIDGSFGFVIPFSLGNTGDLFPKAIKKEVISGFLIFFFVSTRRQNELEIGCFKGIRACSAKGSIALKVTMTTKGVQTTQHRHTQQFQWNNYHLPIQGGGVGAETSSEISLSRESNQSVKTSKAKQANLSHAITCKPLQTVKQIRGPPRTSLPT